ncbi:S53 family peptidase [Kineococcus rhizosphaerae]|uniref:Physarolisin II n=1 Tax=Kineococcus rhizosphaerae TaxID=559628 RepID=A0A2T0R675_9ACTN|nr:S53 family peptidase [Kineococcus rhizosphaerae]PRY16666.1 physarolisin II [Kineococcus rhizosphaerae]
MQHSASSKVSPARLSIRLLTAAVGATALVATGGVAHAAPPRTTTIAGTLPRWLPSGTARLLRSAPVTAPQTVRVYLAPRGGLTALQDAVAAVSTPGSPSYGHYLTGAQYTASYAPTEAAATAVSNYLASAGLHVDSVEANRRYVAATGTPAQLQRAFGVTLASFTHDGAQVVAPTTAASLPTDVAADVLTISGLDTSVQRMTSQHVTGETGSTTATATDTAANRTAAAASAAGVAQPVIAPPAASVVGRPCTQFYGGLLAKYQADYKTPLPTYGGQTLSYALCGYTAPQLFNGLGGDSGNYGKGVTVGIVDAYNSSTIVQDSDTYAKNYGWPRFGQDQYSTWSAGKFTDQEECDASGWTGEQTLDVQAVHAVRPNSRIRYYAAANCGQGLLDALAAVVDENRADVVTNSWGDLETNTGADAVFAYEQVFLQGALQGQTFLFSSGDSGDEVASTGTKQVDYPTSDPYVTSIGGTSTGLGNGTRNVLAESGWGTRVNTLNAKGTGWTDGGYLYGAGGGYSTLFPRPAWQASTVPTSAPTGRGVPDIASIADPQTGMLVGQTQTFPDGIHYGEYRIGGTSLASPLAAGALAEAVQVGGKRAGLANPALYSIARGAYTDVKASPVKGVVRTNYTNGLDPSGGFTYTVRTWGQDSSLALAKGWDPVTGLGRPGATFARTLGKTLGG